MMPRLYIRLITITLVVVVAAQLVIRAQPYDDHGLGELLWQAGCPMPCFMGFQPGVTTRREVIDLLKTNDQFASFSSHWEEEDSNAPMMIVWNKAEIA